MGSHPSLAALGLGHLSMSTMGTQRRRSESSLEATTLLQVRDSDPVFIQLNTNYGNKFFFKFFTRLLYK